MVDDPDGAALPDDPVALRMAIARRYYLDDVSKVDIAKSLGLSRFQVARLLQEARRDGLVRIEIGAPGRHDRELSAALQERLGIERAVVVTSDPSGSSPHAALDHVGRALAAELHDAVDAGDVVGIAWSGAVAAMAASLTDLARCDVVQMGGAVYPPAGLLGSVEVCRRVAAVSGGDSHGIYAPLVVTDTATAAGLRRQPEIAAVLERGRHLDVAVVSVGAWQPSASATYDLLGSTERAELAALGVCGEITSRFVDAEGHDLDTPLDDRVIGVDVGTLRRIPRLITSSIGAFRARATRAVARAGLVSTLVCDDALAEAVLALSD